MARIGRAGEKCNANNRLVRRVRALTILFTLLAIVGCPYGDQAIYSSRGEGVSDNPISARAVFTVEGDILNIFLQNTSAADVTKTAELLVALFFSLPDGLELTPVSATLCDESVVLFAPATDDGGAPLEGGAYPGGDVGAEWGYNGALKNAPHGAMHGISSWGMGGLFGNESRFDRERNIQGPRSPDGSQYGITSLGDNPETGSGAVTGHEEEEEGGGALIQSAVIFRLAGLPQDFTVDLITNISFQYLGLANIQGIYDPRQVIAVASTETLPGDPQPPGDHDDDHEGCGGGHQEP